MYASADARDADIEELAVAEPAQIRDHLMAAVTRLEAAVEALSEELAGTLIERTPGSGRTFPAGAVASMRLREVEIHHADIGAALSGGGYSPADWPDEFTVLLLDHEAKRYAGPGFRAQARDLGRSWEFGTPGPTVTGLGHEIAWWGTGRSPYPGTTGPVSDSGALPGIEGM
jgi:maleylpyruvate isomerase